MIKRIRRITSDWRVAAALLAISVSACDGYTYNEGDLNEPVRYLLDGKKYEVPLGYHYIDFLKRRNRWPNPKKEFSEAGAISITGVIPGFVPYDESNKAEFERLGHGNKVSVIVSPNVTVYPMEEYLRRMGGGGRLQLMSNKLEGLTHYWDSYGGSDETKGADIYIKQGGSEYFMLRCERVEAPSPACNVTKVRPDGLQISYTYSSSHLALWEGIDREVNKRIDQFRIE